MKCQEQIEKIGQEVCTEENMTRNNADFNGVTFNHQDNGRIGARIVAEHPEHGYVGHMLLLGRRSNTSNRKIRDVYVKPEFRRMGFATGMFNYAKQQGLNPVHSDQRTDLGELWAKSTKSRLPKRSSGEVD